MRIEQLGLFRSKEDFNSNDLESESNQIFFKQLGLSVAKGFNNFSQQNIINYDSSTKAAMLNNDITKEIEKNCTFHGFNFVQSLSNTKRCLGILNSKYVVLFKKSPVSNIKTKQNDLIKIEKLEIIYFHGKKIIYSLNLSNYLTIASPMEVVKDSLPTPSVKLKTKKTSEK